MLPPNYLPGLVSVILPTFNRAHLLGATLESIRCQTYKPIEVIVVDDGSLDETGALISRWKARLAGEPGVTIRYARQENSGAPTARNRALRLSEGEFIQYLDSDDTLGPAKLELQVKVLRSEPDSDLVLGDSYDLESGARAEPKRPLSREEGLLKSVTSWTIPVNNPLFRRSACDSLGPWDARMKCFEDASYMAGIFFLGMNVTYAPGAASYIRGHHSESNRSYGPRVSFRGEPDRVSDNVMALYWHSENVFLGFPEECVNAAPYRIALGKESLRVARLLLRIGKRDLAEGLLHRCDGLLSGPRRWFGLWGLRVLCAMCGPARGAAFHEAINDTAYAFKMRVVREWQRVRAH